VLVAVVIVSVGLVLGAEKLKPITWRDWAGEIERDGGARNPYLGLEERYGFWDIRVRKTPRLPFFMRLAHSIGCFEGVRTPDLTMTPGGKLHHYDIKIDTDSTLLDRLSGRSLGIGFGARKR
jgi:hypothetical protein